MKTHRSTGFWGRLLPALIAFPLLAPVAARAAEPGGEPAPTSKVTGIALRQALRITNKTMIAEIQKQLEQIARAAGARLGASETLAWHDGYKPAQAPERIEAVTQALGKAGYVYKKLGEMPMEGGHVTLFGVTHAQKEPLVGFWLAGDELLLLGWGVVTKEGAEPAPQTETPTARPAPPARKGATPADLMGSWSWTTISGVNYRDTTTNQLLEPSGMSTRFTFTPDGRYKFFFYVRQRTYSLVTQATTTEEGTVVFNDDGTFTTRPEKGHYKGSTGSRLIDRDMTTEERKPKSYRWEWRSENNKRQLYIGPDQTSMSRFQPGE